MKFDVPTFTCICITKKGNMPLLKKVNFNYHKAIFPSNIYKILKFFILHSHPNITWEKFIHYALPTIHKGMKKK